MYPEGQKLDDKGAVMATTYRFFITVAGAYVTCRLAPERPMRHAMYLAAVGTVLGCVGIAATINADMGPLW